MNPYGDGPANVSVATERTLLRTVAEAFTLGGGAAALLGGIVFGLVPALVLVGGAGAAAAGLLAAGVHAALLRLSRRYDDGVLPIACVLLYGLLGVGWGFAAQGVAGTLADAGIPYGPALGPLAADALSWVPWPFAGWLGFGAYGYVHGTSVQYRWPTWDLVVLGIPLLVAGFAPVAIVWFVLKAVAKLMWGLEAMEDGRLP